MIQFYREEFDFLAPDCEFFEKIVNPLRLVFIERFEDHHFSINNNLQDDQQHTETMVNYLHNPEFLRIPTLKELCLIFRYEVGPLNSTLEEIMNFVCDEYAYPNRDYINLGLLHEDMYLPFVKNYIEVWDVVYFRYPILELPT